MVLGAKVKFSRIGTDVYSKGIYAINITSFSLLLLSCLLPYASATLLSMGRVRPKATAAHQPHWLQRADSRDQCATSKWWKTNSSLQPEINLVRVAENCIIKLQKMIHHIQSLLPWCMARIQPKVSAVHPEVQEAQVIKCYLHTCGYYQKWTHCSWRWDCGTHRGSQLSAYELGLLSSHWNWCLNWQDLNYFRYFYKVLSQNSNCIGKAEQEK